MKHIIKKKKNISGIIGLNFASLTVQTFTVMILTSFISLIISIMAARVLGPEGKGILTVIILYPTLLHTLGHLSVYRALTVHVAERKYSFADFPGTAAVFVFSISAILMIGFLIAYFNFNKYFIQDINFLTILFALGIIPCAMFIQIFTSILQAKGKMFEFNLNNLLSKGLVLVFIILMLIVLRTGVNGAVFAYFIANVLATILVIYFVRKITFEKWKFNPLLLKDLIKDGVKLHIGIIASFIFLRIDMLMLGYYRQASSVGYYSIAVSMADLLIIIPTVVMHVFYSKIADMINDKKDMARKTVLVYKHTMLFMVAATLIFAVVAKPVIKIFYGEEFLPSIIPFLILLPGVCFFRQNNIFSYYLVGTKKFLLISLLATVGSLINVMLNLIFIPKYDGNGAAVASLITYFFMGTAYFVFFFRVSKFKLMEFLKKIMISKEDIIFYKTFFSKIIRIN